ncbi:MAG: hypothetical protein BWY99_01931 [Synergistetes bacterium ADurb.BinA166]|nr:MAG: hypothetical protein BWY99_01931 [Synergistetes bacterium ADurb.BinA166]
MPGVGQEDLRAPHDGDVALVPVQDVPGLSGRDGDAVVDLAAVVLDNRVLFPREVDHPILAGDEQLLPHLVLDAILLVVGDDLDVDARVLIELDGAELPGLEDLAPGVRVLALREDLGRLRENDGRAVLVALVPVLVAEEAVLEALEGDGLADQVPVLVLHDLDAGRRDVEGDVRPLHDELLTHRQILGLDVLSGGRTVVQKRSEAIVAPAFDGSGRLHDGALPVLPGGVLVVDAGKDVLVGADVVALEDLAHLARPERE